MIYGYGEDALTLYAMTKGFPLFLDQLQDKTPSDRAVIYFRPSFGRRSPNPKVTPSVFGEFDAIVVTERATYLVEAKWNNSTELQETTLTVADRQRRRHEIFRWYHDQWQQIEPLPWADFRSRNKASFEARFPGLTIPTAGTTLAKNLEYILTSVSRQNVPLVDVLLFTTVHDTIRPTAVDPPSFKLVVMHAPSVGGDGFIEL